MKQVGGSKSIEAGLQKGHFTEQGLLKKATNINLHNNRKQEYEVHNGQAYWRERHTDAIREFSTNQKLHYPTQDPLRVYSLRQEYATCSQSVLSKSRTVLELRSKPQERRHRKEVSAIDLSTTPPESKLFNLPAIGAEKSPKTMYTSKYSEILGQDLGRPPQPSYNNRDARQVEVLLRYFVDKPIQSSTLPLCDSKPQWERAFGGSKTYTKGTETALTVVTGLSRHTRSMLDIDKSANMSRTQYNMINGTRNRYSVSNVPAFLTTQPFALRRKTTAISEDYEKVKGENLNEVYQRTAKQIPHAFHRSGKYGWNEVVARKSYGLVLRNTHSLFT